MPVVMDIVRAMFMSTILRVTFGKIVMMKMKKPLQKEHCQKAAQHPGHRAVQRMQLLRGIRKEMQERDAQHQPSYETDCHLKSRVSQFGQQD